MQFRKAIDEYNVVEARRLFEEGTYFEKRIFASSFYDGMTALHMFVEDNDFAKQLIPFSDVDALTTSCRSTPLHIAMRCASLEVINLLIDNGADIHAVNIHGITPLRYAFTTKKYDVIVRIMGMYDGRDDRFNKIHSLIADRGTIDQLETMLGILEERNLMTSKIAGTYFGFAVYSDAFGVVKRLLEYTPFAFQHNFERQAIRSVAMANLLLEYGALPTWYIDYSISHTILYGDVEIVKHFLTFQTPTKFSVNLHYSSYEIIELLVLAGRVNIAEFAHRLKTIWDAMMIHKDCCQSKETIENFDKMRRIYRILYVAYNISLPKGEELPTLFNIVDIKERLHLLHSGFPIIRK